MSAASPRETPKRGPFSVTPCAECRCPRDCPWVSEKKINRVAVPCKSCDCRWCGSRATREEAYTQGVRDVCAMLRAEHAAGSFGSPDFMARCIEEVFKATPNDAQSAKGPAR